MRPPPPRPARIAFAACVSASTKARRSCIVYDEQNVKYLHRRIEEQRVCKKGYYFISTLMIFCKLFIFLSLFYD
jgi:hypothetical protein